MTKENRGNQTVKSVAWTSVGNWGGQLLSFLIYAGLARLLGPETFGVLAIAAVYLTLVQLFVTQGFGAAIIQRADLDAEHLDAVFWIELVIALTVCLLTIAFSPMIATAFKEPKITPVLRWLSLSFPISAFSAVPMAVLERNMNFKALVIRQLLGQVAGGAVGLALALNGWGVWSLVAQQLVGSFGGVLCLWWAISWRPRCRFSLRHLRELYSFALGILGNDVLWFFCQRADQTLVGYKFGATALGPYSLAIKLTQLLNDSLLGPLTSVAFAKLSRLQSDSERLKAAFYRFTEIGIVISFPALIGLIAVAPDAVDVVFGPKWISTTPILRVLACYGLVKSVTSFYNPVMLAKGRPGLYFVLFAINTASTIADALVGLKWGPIGVASALTLVQFLLAWILFPFLRDITEIEGRQILQLIKVPVLNCIGMVCAVLLVQNSLGGHLQRLVLSIVVGASTYGVLFAIFNRRLAMEMFKHVKMWVPFGIPWLEEA
jgi:PST family polysaccharide transporter